MVYGSGRHETTLLQVKTSTGMHLHAYKKGRLAWDVKSMINLILGSLPTNLPSLCDCAV